MGIFVVEMGRLRFWGFRVFRLFGFDEVEFSFSIRSFGVFAEGYLRIRFFV